MSFRVSASISTFEFLFVFASYLRDANLIIFQVGYLNKFDTSL